MPTTIGDDIQKAIAYVEKSVAGKSTLPILTHILMEYKPGEGITFRATNLEVAASITLRCRQMIGDEGFSLAIPAKVLKESLGSIDKGTQVILEAATGDALKVQAGGLKFSLKGMPGSDFPYMPDFNEATTFTLPISTLVGLFDTTAYAASTDDSRPTLTGIEMAFKDGSIATAGTDGYRLAYYCLEGLVPADYQNTLIVPARSVAEFVRIATKAQGEAKHGASDTVTLAITENRNQIMFKVDVAGQELVDAILVSQLIDARFPDYRAIIPKSKNTTVTVDAADLERALKTVKPFTKDNAGITRIDVVGTGDPRDTTASEGTLTVRATSAEMGEVEQELRVSVMGAPISMAFNIKYLQETVAHIDGEEMVIEFTQATRPGLFRAATNVDGTNIHVVMPMHPPR